MLSFGVIDFFHKQNLKKPPQDFKKIFLFWLYNYFHFLTLFIPGIKMKNANVWMGMLLMCLKKMIYIGVVRHQIRNAHMENAKAKNFLYLSSVTMIQKYKSSHRMTGSSGSHTQDVTTIQQVIEEISSWMGAISQEHS